MKKDRFTDKQIIDVLREAERTTIAEAARKHEVSEQSIYRWRSPAWGKRISKSFDNYGAS